MEKEREMRISPEEIEIIKSTFKGNVKLIKLLRKIFYPELDTEAPLGQQIDLWMVNPPMEGNEKDKINLVARNMLLQHIEQQLIQLNILAETDAKTLEEAREQIKKNSNK
jgi:hypothetical protein